MRLDAHLDAGGLLDVATPSARHACRAVAHGLAPLSLDDQLVAKAHDWAAVMAGSGVRHSRLTDGAGSNWTIIAENVGRAATVSEMHRLFMTSPVHRSNILDPRMSRIGTGVAASNGQVFVVQVVSG
jgi:uncharacterized protein YkwD